MDTYTVALTQTDILAARLLVRNNLKRGVCSPAYLLKIAETPLPLDEIEGQEKLW